MKNNILNIYDVLEPHILVKYINYILSENHEFMSANFSQDITLNYIILCIILNYTILH